MSQDSLASEVTTCPCPCPIERFDSSSSANSEGDSRTESVYSDFNDCFSEAGASEFCQLNDAGVPCASAPPASPSEGVEMLEDMEDMEEHAPYSSPREAGSDRRCSRREARPPKQWDSQVEVPLLKWEKEQQQPRGKRRAVKRHAAGKLAACSERPWPRSSDCRPSCSSPRAASCYWQIAHQPSDNETRLESEVAASQRHSQFALVDSPSWCM